MARNEPEYLPDYDELWARVEAMRWMTDMEWPDLVIEQCLVHDNPTLDVIRDLVYRHGPDKAVKILLKFAKD